MWKTLTENKYVVPVVAFVGGFVVGRAIYKPDEETPALPEGKKGKKKKDKKAKKEAA